MLPCVCTAFMVLYVQCKLRNYSGTIQELSVRESDTKKPKNKELLELGLELRFL